MFTFKIKAKLVLIVLWRLLNIFTLLIPAFVIVLFAKKTDEKTKHYDQPPIQRYRLPKWLRWAESPDEHLPGGLYEPTVMDLYFSIGWFPTSVYWIGLRNVGNGIIWDEGKEVPKKFKEMTAEEKKKFGLWSKEKLVFFDKLKVIYGWETVRDWHNTKTKNQGLWAVPRFTIRRSDQD